MKARRIALFAGLFATLFFAGPAQAATPIRVDCIGDSITVGYTDNPTWSVPYEFGYRSGLYTLMSNAGYSFQFVGSSLEPWNGTFGLPTNTPSPDLRTVNQDHCEGYGGVGTSYVLSNINGWLTADNPDVVLLMIGINDIGAGSSGNPTGAESNLNTIVQNIVTTKPNADVIVAQITPYSSYTDSIVEYNNYIANTLVPSYKALGDHVTTVNQYVNLLTNGTIDPTKFSNGFNHPSNAAYGQMAQTWFQGIKALGLSSGSSSVPDPYWSGSGTWDLNVTQDWATASGGPYNTAYWTDSTTYGRDRATFEGTAGTVTLNSNLSAYVLQFTVPGGGYTISGARTLILGAGGINAAAQTSGATTISGGTLSLQGGQSWTLGGGTLTVNDTVARNIGATVDFSTSGTFNGSGLLAAAGTTVGGGPSGVAWATVGGSNWAISNGSQIASLGSYTPSTAGTTAPGSAANVDFQASNTTSWNTQSINSLRFDTAAATTLTMSSGQTLTLSSGGILVTGNVGNNLSTITGGTLRGASGKELVVIQNNGSNGLTIGSVITDNGSATGLTKSGSGTLTLTAANSFTGPTVVNAGQLTIASGGSINAASAISVNTDGTLAFGESSNGNTLTLNGGRLTVVGSPDDTGTGGTITQSGGNVIHSFTLTGTSSLYVPYAVSGGTVLVVGGGGGGGCTIAGGGGAGGLIYSTLPSISGGTTSVVVGAGGAGAVGGTPGASQWLAGASGGNSSFGTSLSLTASGGGGGGGWSIVANGSDAICTGLPGGSGGGGAQGRNGGAGTAGQGYAGGKSTAPGAGGGGGAGGNLGTNGTTTQSGSGGAGVQYSISGTPTWYAGGGGGGGGNGAAAGAGGIGGGGAGSANNVGASGVNGTGGGGGGGGYDGSTVYGYGGGAGGSGIVIVSYPYIAGTLGQITLSGSITVPTTSTLDALGNGGQITVASAMTGAGGINVESSGDPGGIVAYTSSQSYGGDTTVTVNGTLKMGAVNALPYGAAAGNLSLNGTLDLGGMATTNVNGLSGAGLVTSSAAGAMTLLVGNNDVSGVFSGTLGDGSGTLGLTKAGTGTQTLSGVNTYSGGTTISGGALSVKQFLGSNGVGSGTVTVNGGTLNVNYDGTNYNTGTSRTFSNTITGSGTVALSGLASTIVTTPIFQPSSMAGFTGTVNIDTGINYVYYLLMPSSSTSTTFDGSGCNWVINNQNVNSFVYTTGTVGVVRLGALSGNGSVSNNNAINSTLEVGALGTSTTFSGVLRNNPYGGYALALSKVGSGMLTLSGSNTYTDVTNVSGGTLQIGNGGSGASIGSTSGVVLSNNANITFNHADAVTWTKPSTGTGSFTQTGTGTLTLAAAQNYTGPTIISNGTLKLAQEQSVILANPSFESDAGIANSFDYQTITGWTYTAGASINSGNPGNYLGIEQGTSHTFAPAAPPNYDSSSNYKWAIIQSYNVASGGTATMSQTVTVPTSGVYTVGFAAAGRGGNGPQNIQVEIDGVNETPGGTITPSTSAWNQYSSNAVVLSAGSHILLFNFITTGGDKSDVLDAVTMTGFASGATNVLPATTDLSIAAGSTLDLSGGSQQVASLSGSGLLTTSDSTSPAVFTVGDSSSTVFYGQITDSSATGGMSGGLSLIKIGAGTLTLSGTNTYAGGTTVLEGTMVLDSATAIQDGTSLTIGTDAGTIFGTAAARTNSSSVPAVTVVPEPGTLALLAAGLVAGMGITLRRSTRPKPKT